MSFEKPTKIVDLRVRVPASLDREIEQLSRQRFYRSKADFVRDLCRREVAAPSRPAWAENAKREAAFGRVD